MGAAALVTAIPTTKMGLRAATSNAVETLWLDRLIRVTELRQVAAEEAAAHDRLPWWAKSGPLIFSATVQSMAQFRDGPQTPM